MRRQLDGSDGAIQVSIDFGESDYNESLTELRLLAETAGIPAKIRNLTAKRIPARPARTIAGYLCVRYRSSAMPI